MRARLLLLAVLAASACSSQLPDRALVTDLRILGVRADHPEASPGDKVHLDALVADPNGGGRHLIRAWAICTPGSGGVGTCGDPTHVAELGTGLTADWTVPADALADLSPADQAVGRDVFVVYATAVDDGSGSVDSTSVPHDIAFKRIRISTNPAPNQNPSIGQLLLDGKQSDPIDVTAGTQLLLTATIGSGSAQTWSSANGTSGTEALRFTWLVTAGSLGDDVSYADGAAFVEDRWNLPGTNPSSGTAMLWVVLRDDRGGIDWSSRVVKFAP